MLALLFNIALFATCIFMFFRQDRVEVRQDKKRDLEGDLHMLKQMRLFYEEREKDTATMDLAIREIERELEQIQKERAAAAACGYDFVIGVSTQEHKDALIEMDFSLDVVVTGCKR
ncbi:MAG: hypothetical protein EOO68_26965 [Moraxellaceae bacterium]|nr:MAG: hypothetical protein EOO68_26965 [Moraxellaceae bacterium]